MLRSILVGVLALSCFSLAHAQEDLAHRIQQRSEDIRQLLYSRARSLSSQTQLQILEQLRGIETLVSRDNGNGGGNGGGGRPAPYPDPAKPPTRPSPPSYGNSIRGQIENQSFNFDGSSRQDIFDQCVAFVQSKGLIKVDDISVSVNFRDAVVLRNSSSYWNGAGEVCLQVNDVLIREGIQADRSLLSFDGAMETYGFSFRGRSFAEVSTQCEAFVKAKGLSQVDDIVVSVNMEPLKVLRNSSSYWRGSFEICQQVLQQR